MEEPQSRGITHIHGAAHVHAMVPAARFDDIAKYIAKYISKQPPAFFATISPVEVGDELTELPPLVIDVD